MAVAPKHRAAYDWQIADPPRAQIKSLADALGVPPLVAQLLINRGANTHTAAQAFLNPGGAELGDPSLLTGMDTAVERIQHAAAHSEHIRVYGDYDVDGITATAILLRALDKAGCRERSFAVPSRLSDGYGLQPKGVEEAKAEGVDLLITVDNGIKSHDAADAAREAGIDLIITDHHTLGESLPPALAVINPKLDDPDSPLADLCGAGVASKLATALTGHADLDLAALGTVADLVPLTVENRALVTLGLEWIRANPKPGIHALIRHAGLQLNELTSESIAFQLGPRLNAAARVGIGTTALDLLLCQCPKQSAAYAQQLHAANEERRRIERRIFEEACAMLEEDGLLDRTTIVLGSNAWHPGVLGIVAARLLDTYGKPAVLVAFDDDGLGRGSARSTPEFDIAARLTACADLLVRHGGHLAAGGFTLLQPNLEAFQTRFEEAAQHVELPALRPLDVDAIVGFSQIDGQLIKLLQRLEPYGEGNRPPVFASYGVTLVDDSLRELRGGHIRFQVMQGRQVFTAIGFNMAHHLPALQNGRRKIDIAYSPKLNTWRGETTIQLQLKDIG